MDIVIRDAIIYDGTGVTPYSGHVAIKGERIETVGGHAEPTGGRIIEAAGLAVCPGFVDIHSHSDYYLLSNPEALSKIMQGVTTEIGGNCGFSAAPVAGEQLVERKRTVGEELDLTLDWETTEEYFSRLEEQGISVNYGAFVGHNTVRGSVMGFAHREPSNRELDLMRKEVELAAEQGALGFSSGLIYPPACFAGREELTLLCASLPPGRSVFSCHIRSEGDELIEALGEVVAVSEAAGASLQISHLKTSGKRNWAKLDRAFEVIEEAAARGLDITCDRYPYLAGNTGLQAILPHWALDGDTGQRVARLRKEREKALRELREADAYEDHWNSVMISAVSSRGNRDLEGLTLKEAAKLRNTSPESLVVDLFIEEEGKVEVILFSMCEENLRRILAKPYVMVASDAGARTDSGPLARGKPHPRGFATFVRALAHYAGGEGNPPLEEVIRKCTSMPCGKMGIDDRGSLAPGYYADVVVFDPRKLSDTATYTDPIKYPEGIEYVIVNGRVTVEGGRHTGARAGKVIRGTA